MMDNSPGPEREEPGLNLFRVLMKRRSARAFSDREIPEPLIEQMLDVAANGPSGGNIQPLSIIVIQDVGKRKALAHLVGDQPWVKSAPLSMIFCLDFYRIKKWAAMCQTEFKGDLAVNHFLIGFADVMIAAQSVAILAESYGLGSVYVGTILHEIDQVRQFFKIPELVLPMMLLSIGYPKSLPQSIPKLKRGVIFHREEYRKPESDEIRRAFDEKYGALDQVVEKYLEKAFVEILEHDKQEGSNQLERVKRDMKRLDIQNNAQFLFKLRYPSEVMVRMNRNLIQSFRNAGFEMFAANEEKEQGLTQPPFMFPEDQLGSEK